jgi:hypothetical protein
VEDRGDYREDNEYYNQATKDLVCSGASHEHQQPVEDEPYDEDVNGARDIKP